jgi:hypothetical protein
VFNVPSQVMKDRRGRSLQVFESEFQIQNKNTKIWKY